MSLDKVAILTLHAIHYVYSHLKTFVQRIQNEANLINKTFPFHLSLSTRMVMNVYFEKSHIKLDLCLHTAT